MSHKVKVYIDHELQPIIPQFFHHLARYIDDLDKAIAAGQTQKVAALSHKSMGSSGSYGFSELQNLFEQLHRLAGIGDFSQATFTLDCIKSHISALHIEYVETDDES